MRTLGHVAKTVRTADKSADGIRKRRATANRILTVLKSALNHAWKSGHVARDDPWRRIKPSAQPYWIATVRPSIQPSSRSRSAKAAVQALQADADAVPRKPMVGTFARAWAATGQ